MRLLILGGTVFVGRAVAEAALARGDEVTVFHRGRHGAGLFGDRVETVLGDRTTDDVDRLRGRRWDVVVDTSGFAPADVARSVAAISCERYVFVSTAGVYRDWPLRPVDESSPLHESGDGYAELKAACERELPPGAATVRPGVIVGPHENIGRLPYWLRRMARGGRVLAPGTPDVGIQLIDVRDLAAFCLDCPPGAFNAVARPRAWSWGQLLETAREVAGAPGTRLCWTPAARVLEAVPDPWGVLPLWPAPLADMPAVYEIGVERSLAAGLGIRRLEDTVADTWAWLSEGGELGDWRAEVQVSGLDADAEAALVSG